MERRPTAVGTGEGTTAQSSVDLIPTITRKIEGLEGY